MWPASRSGTAATVRARCAWAYDAFLLLRDPHRGLCTWLPRARYPSRLPSRSCAIPVAAVPHNPLPVSASGLRLRDLRLRSTGRGRTSAGGALLQDLVGRVTSVCHPCMFILVSFLIECLMPFPPSFCLCQNPILARAGLLTFSRSTGKDRRPRVRLQCLFCVSFVLLLILLPYHPFFRQRGK